MHSIHVAHDDCAQAAVNQSVRDTFQAIAHGSQRLTAEPEQVIEQAFVLRLSVPDGQAVNSGGSAITRDGQGRNEQKHGRRNGQQATRSVHGGGSGDVGFDV